MMAKRKVTTSIEALAVEEVRVLVEKECDRILLACDWGEPGDDNPKQHLEMLIGWVTSHIMQPIEGIVGAYRGTAQVEAEAKVEYKRLRRSFNSALGKATLPVSCLMPGLPYFDREMMAEATAQIRAEAALWIEKEEAEGSGSIGFANQLIRGLAVFPDSPPGFYPDPLPTYSEAIELIPVGNSMRRETNLRVALVRELQEAPAFLLPRPLGSSQLAAISILSGIPKLELVRVAGAKTVADLVEAEARRIAKLEQK